MRPQPGDDSEGPHASPGFWLHHAALVWRAELEAALKETGLTAAQFIALASIGWLGRDGEPPTQQEVAEHSGGDRMMTSRLVRVLADRGLVERSADAADARSVRLVLTPEGRRVARLTIDRAQQTDRAVFGAGGGELRDGLRAIAARRDRASTRPSPSDRG